MLRISLMFLVLLSSAWAQSPIQMVSELPKAQWPVQKVGDLPILWHMQSPAPGNYAVSVVRMQPGSQKHYVSIWRNAPTFKDPNKMERPERVTWCGEFIATLTDGKVTYVLCTDTLLVAYYYAEGNGSSSGMYSINLQISSQHAGKLKYLPDPAVIGRLSVHLGGQQVGEINYVPGAGMVFTRPGHQACVLKVEPGLHTGQCERQ